jgi:hypothetical protein
LTNKQYIDIVKYCENKDIEGFCNYFDQWLEPFKDLNCIEKFYVLIAMRVIFIDPYIHCSSGIGQVLQYDLNNILLVLDGIENSYKDKIYLTSGGIIELDIPRSLNPHDIITSSIISNSTEYIPANTIYTFLSKVDNMYKNVFFLSGYEEHIKTPIKLSIIDGILPVFLMELFGKPLMDVYQTQYHFLNKVSKSYDHYISLTPGETNLIMKMYSEEIEKQNRELNKQQ